MMKEKIGHGIGKITLIFFLVYTSCLSGDVVEENEEKLAKEFIAAIKKRDKVAYEDLFFKVAPDDFVEKSFRDQRFASYQSDFPLFYSASFSIEWKRVRIMAIQKKGSEIVIQIAHGGDGDARSEIRIGNTLTTNKGLRIKARSQFPASRIIRGKSLSD
ncbi:hypothetical protein V2O64_04370 [Verrucomicrobiaceae bacterium 227]